MRLPKFLTAKPSDKTPAAPIMPRSEILDNLASRSEPPRLTPESISSIANNKDIPRATLLTVMRVEVSGGRGFQKHSDGLWRPVVRYEAHKGNEYTDGIYLKEYPHLFRPKLDIKHGNAPQEVQYERLNEVLALTEGMFGIAPAFEATSWGVGQVMGANYLMTGAGSLERFIGRMASSEEEQLDAMLTFIENAGLRKHLVNREWYKFARGYNGSARARKYEASLQRQYQIVTGMRV